jgi:SAF domain-containing protein
MTDLSVSTPGVVGDERPVGPRRSVRVPYLVAAAGLALATAVLVLWGFSQAADRTEVLVVRAPVAAGTPIPASALSTTMVGVDAGVGRLYPAGTDLSGVVAATDLEPGDLLSASMVEAAPELPEGWREVGAVVRRGRFPSTLQVGDDMVAVPLDGTGEVPVVVVSSSVGGDGAMSVVLGVDAADATAVAQWAAGDRLTLVRVL